MTPPLVLVDADVLGRERTGDETYVENLLRNLPSLADGLRLGAVTRHPELVPPGVEPVFLPARSQEARMAWRLPRLLRRLRPSLAHFQHALPLAWRGRSVVTVHDLSFERDASLMPIKERTVFRLVVRRAARRADHVIAVSERTKRDVVELYGIPPDRVTVTPHGVDPAFTADGAGREPNGYVLFVGAIHKRKNPVAAALAARELGLRLVVAGPASEPETTGELVRLGAELRGYLGKPELAALYRGAACLVLPSRYEGFGLPVLEAMACGTPVVAAPDPALREVAGEAAIFAGPGELADGIRRALAERDRLVEAGLERTRAFSWRETARRTVAVYRRVLGIA